ncbi:MAG: terminase small subunit [Endozoicomonas sp.]
MSAPALNLKQQKFVEAYLGNDGNALQSYREAYGTQNYGTEGSNGHRLLKNAEVVARIEQRRAEIMASSTIRIERKRLELWEIARQSRAAGDLKTAIMAIAELNRMDGSYRRQS